LVIRDEYDSGSKTWQQINIIVWILGFTGPGLTILVILVAIYSCIFEKSSSTKKQPLLDPSTPNTSPV